MTVTRRSDLIAAGCLALLPCLLFPDVVFFGFGFFQRDLLRFSMPNAWVFRDVVLRGEFPWWNPLISGGQPLAANPNYGVFYPPNWLLFLPDFNLAFQLVLLLHVSIALVGMFAFLRSLGLRADSSFFGALSFGVSGLLLSYLNVTNLLFAIAWIPWILLFGVRAIRHPNRRDISAAALFLGMQFIVAEPTMILQTVLSLIAFGMYEVVSSRRPVGESARRAGAVALMVGVAFCIAAVQLIPAIDLLRDTERAGGLQFEMVRTWSMPPARPIELVFPEVFGHKQQGGLFYWGGRNYSPPSAPYVLDLYVGLAVVVLALAGLVGRVRGAVPLLAIGVASYVVAIGDHTPLLRWLYDDGFFRSLRYPEKFILTGLFALILLAALTLDRAMKGDRSVFRLATVIGGLVAAFALTGFILSLLPGYAAWFGRYWGFADGPTAATLAAISRADWAQTIIRAVVVVTLLRFVIVKGPTRLWYVSALVFLLFDLCFARGRVLERQPPSFFERPPIAAEVSRMARAARLVHEPSIASVVFGQQISPPGNARYEFARNTLAPRISARHGIATVYDGDYDLTNLRPSRELFSGFVANWTIRGRDAAEVFFSIANVGAVMRSAPGSPHSLLILPRTHQRYFFADQVVQIRDLPDFIDKTLRRSWSSRVAFVPFTPFDPGRGEVLAAEESASCLKLNVRSRGRSLLVVSVTPHRYWRAWIDGTEVRPLPANVGFQALAIGEGDHQIEMRYRNPLIARSGALSALALIAVAVAILGGGRRTAEIRAGVEG